MKSDENCTTLRCLYYPPLPDNVGKYAIGLFENVCTVNDKQAYSRNNSTVQNDNHKVNTCYGQGRREQMSETGVSVAPQKGLTSFKTLFKKSTSRGKVIVSSLIVELKAGQVRCGEHSDYGSITLLFQDGVGGLEVKLPFFPLIANVAKFCLKFQNKFSLPPAWPDTPPRQIPPPFGYYGIRSTSGSYWNAYLFKFYFGMEICVL